MGNFWVILFVGLAILTAAIVLAGMLSSRSVADILDWRPARSAEEEAALDAEDADQMLEAANEHRRARGAGELTEQDVADSVAEDERFIEGLRHRDD